LRKLGYTADVVERRVPGCFTTRDLFGIADILGVHPEERIILLVQTTSRDHLADRLRRVRACPALPLLLAAGMQVELWGWAKRNGRWHAARVAIRPGDLEAVTIADLPRSRRPDRRSGRPAPLEDGKRVGVRKQPSTKEGKTNETR
jgi:hypothetical protein